MDLSVSMAQNNASTNVDGDNTVDDQFPALDEEKLEDLESQLDLRSYDPSTDPLLQEELPRAFDEKGVDPLVEARIMAAVGKKDFPLTLQYETLGSTIMTLGQLAESRCNEHAQQFLYPKRVLHVLFGKYGLAKGFRLSSVIEVCFFRNPNTGELENMVINSGRHRCTGIIALLQYLGVKKWEDQKIQVVARVVNSDPEFAQLIETANDSRKMPRAELQVHGLTRMGVRTATAGEFYESRFHARSAQLGHVFAKAVQFELAGLPQTSQDTIVSMVGSAWNHAFNTGSNRTPMRELILSSDDKPLKEAARFVASIALDCITNGVNAFPGSRAHVAAPRMCAQRLAGHLGLEAPHFDR